jgi:hypothetical protein
MASLIYSFKLAKSKPDISAAIRCLPFSVLKILMERNPRNPRNLYEAVISLCFHHNTDESSFAIFGIAFSSL